MVVETNELKRELELKAKQISLFESMKSELDGELEKKGMFLERSKQEVIADSSHCLSSFFADQGGAVGER